MPSLPTWIKPNVRYDVFFNENNVNNKRYQIRGIIDNQVVVRRWLKRKRRWSYECQDETYFQSYAQYIRIVKTK